MKKNLWNLSNEKTQYSFMLNYRVVGEEVWGGGGGEGMKGI